MATLDDLVRARRAQSTDEPPELLKRPAEEPAPPKRTLGDLVRTRRAEAAPSPPPGAAVGTAVGDFFRRTKEREETPELLRRPDPTGPEPGDDTTDEGTPELLKRPEGLYPGDPGVPTRLEKAGLFALRTGVPIAAGIATGALAGPGGPVVGPLVGAATGTAASLAAQKYEKARGFRKEVSPYGVMWEGALNAFPGLPFKAGLTAPLRIAARTAEGAGIGGIGVTGSTWLEEGRLPTKEELAWGAGMGGLFGAGGGTFEAKGVPYLHERSPEFIGPREFQSKRQLRATSKALATSTEQLAGEITAPPADAPKMVTKPGETIGPPSEPVAGAPPSEFVGPPAPEMTPHPVGSDVNFREIGEQERTTPGRIVAHQVDPDTGEPRIMVGSDDGFVRGRPMDDVELAPAAEVAPPGSLAAVQAAQQQQGAAPEFVGPPEAPVTAYHGTVKDFETLNTPAYLSDEEAVAQGFADRRFAAGAYEGEGEPRVGQYSVQFRNPLVIDAAGEHAGNIQFASGDKYGFRRALDPDSPYDGVIIRNTADEGTVYVVNEGGQARRVAPEDVAPPGGEAPPPGGGGPPPPGRPSEAPPPGGEEPLPGETGPYGQRPTFRRYPGLGEALTDEEIAAQRHADPERVTRAIESVDREFGGVIDDESRARLKQQIVDNQERFEYLGRGTQTMERTRGLGRDYLVDIDAAKLEPKGSTWNAEQTQAMKNHIAGLDLAIQDAQKAYDADPTPQNGLILQKAAQDQVDAFFIFRARGAEAGRTINIYKGTAEELASGNQRLLMAALRRGVPPQKLAEIIGSTKPEDVIARAELLMAYSDRGGLYKRTRNFLKTIFISNILSGPGPHERNTLGNSVRAYMATPAAELFGAAHERLAGVPEGERLLRAGGAARHYVGVYDSTPDAIHKTAEILKRGYTMEQAATYDLPLNEAFIGAHPVLRGAVNAVPRGLGGMDMFFRVQGQEGSLYSQAWTRGMNEALVERAAGKLPQGMTFDARVEQLYRHYQANPTPEMMTQAAEEATRGVYQERDKIARWVTSARDIIPFGDFIIPFVTTSTNLAKQGLHWTPAGYLMKSTRGKVEGISPRTVALHKGEALGGTVGMLLAPLALYAMGGKIHGSGPSDWDERQEWLKTHTPNAIELGGVNVGFNWMGPFAIPLAAVGNLWDKYDDIKQKQGYISPQDMDDLAQEMILGTAESVLDQPYLQGLSNFINMVTHIRGKDGARYRNKFFKDIGTGFIPASGFLRWGEQVVDPTIRESRTLGEKAMGGIPWVSEHGIPGLAEPPPPKLDPFGEPQQVRTIGGPVGRAIFPFPVEYSERDPLREELHRQDLKLSPPSSITVKPEEGPPLTPREDLAIKQAKGKQLRVQLEELYASDAYRRADPETQKKMLKSMTGRTRAAIGARAKGMRGRGIVEEALRW